MVTVVITTSHENIVKLLELAEKLDPKMRCRVGVLVDKSATMH